MRARWWRVGLAMGLAGCLDFGPRPVVDGSRDAAPPSDATRGDAGPDAGSGDAMAPDRGIEALSTEFDTPESIAGWQTFGARGFRLVDAGEQHRGRLTIRPALGGWHEVRTAGLLYVEVEGDFIAETDIVAGMIGDLERPPLQAFNVAGLMGRDPTAAGADWFFVGMGRLLDGVGIEGKSTVDGVSTQSLTNVGDHVSTLRLCRRGTDVYLLYRLEADPTWRSVWEAPGPVVREGLSARLQVGFFANGWNTTEPEPATEGEPDLEAVFEAIRFRRPIDVRDCTE